jgi:hypothetical protein
MKLQVFSLFISNDKIKSKQIIEPESFPDSGPSEDILNTSFFGEDFLDKLKKKRAYGLEERQTILL